MAADLKAWPSDWPQYKQRCFASFDDRCDMLIGPCACGAWHQPGEFELLGGRVLMRNGRQIQEDDLRQAETP